MARDGSGNYSLVATMAVTSTTASSVTVNSIMNDIAQALTDSINKDGTKAFAQNQSMGGNRLTSLGAAIAATDAVQYQQAQRGTANRATTVGGTVDAITLICTPPFTALTSGMKVRWVSAGANTVTTPTLNVDGLGAITLKRNPGAAALGVGDLGASGTELEATYNGTNFILTTLATVALLNASTQVFSGTMGVGRSVAAGYAFQASGTIGANDGTVEVFMAPVAASGASIIGNVSNHAMGFYTNNTERFRVTANGGMAFAGGANFGTSGQVLKSNGDAPPSWVASGGMTLLGSLFTTSGASQNLSGLSLGNYKYLRFAFNGVSGTGTGLISVGSYALFASNAAGDTLYGYLDLELSTGLASSFVSKTFGGTTGGGTVGATGYNNASTSVGVSVSSGTLDAGSVNIYGIS